MLHDYLSSHKSARITRTYQDWSSRVLTPALSPFPLLSANDIEDEEEDEAMVLAASVALQRKRDMAAAGQNATLYGEEGQYNPHAARALKKKRRKGAGEEDESVGRGGKKAAGKSKKQSNDSGSEDFDFDETAAGQDEAGGDEGMAE